MSDIESFREKLQTLITKFEKDKTHYLSKGYPEAQVRIDFLNPLFKALGWDIENKAQKPPYERDVIVELSPETTGRPDYNFRINGATKGVSQVMMGSDTKIDFYADIIRKSGSAEKAIYSGTAFLRQLNVGKIKGVCH